MNPLLQKRPLPLLEIALALALLLLCALTFHHVFSCDFVPLDDNVELTDNPHIHALSPENLRWMFTNTSLTQRYTPFSWIVWALIYKVFGLNPAAFHALAFIVHLANTLLVFGLLRTILRRTIPNVPSCRTLSLVAAFGAALWAVHPLRVEVLGWATQVRFGEASLFALLSLLAYLRAADTSPLRILRSPYFWLSVAAYGISIGFYPIHIGLAALLPLLDLYLLRRPHTRSEPRALLHFTLEKIPFLLLALFTGILAILGRFSAPAFFEPAATLAQFGIPARILQAGYIFIYYLWKPFDLFHICPVYTQLYDFNPFTPIFILSLAAFITLTVLAFRSRNRHPYLFLLWAAHVLLLFPVGGYFEHPHYPTDRYSYLQGILLPLVLAVAAIHLARHATRALRPLIPVVAALLILLCAAFSFLYTRAWTNGESFLLAILCTLGDEPFRLDIETRLGKYYAEHNDYRQALFYLDQVIPRAPTYPRPFYFKGMTLLKIAEIGEAQHQPPSTLAPLYHQAESLLDQAATLAPSATNFTSAADAYFEAKDFANAQPRYEAALALDPHNSVLQDKIARCAAATPQK